MKRHSWTGPRSFEPECVTLDNGLRFLLIENSSVPAISFNMSFNAGSRNEPEERAGLVVMVSRLLDEGTSTRSALEIADAIESVGGAIDCEGGYERAAAFLSVLSKDLDLGLELVADIVMNPRFEPESLEMHRERILAEIRSAVDRPQVVAGWEFNELVYGTHPLHRPVHGYPHTVEKITVNDLRAFHEQWFVPNNATVSIVGDFKAEELAAKLAETFGEWAPRQVEAANLPRPERQHEIRRKSIGMPTQQAHVYFGHLGVERANPDYYALQILDTILGGGAGLTARIPHKLRDEQGLAYTTFASITSTAGIDPGKFIAYIGTSPENVDQALEGFVEEVGRIRTEPVTTEELEDAKAYLTGSFVFAFETSSQIGRFLINAEAYELGFDYPQKYPAFIDAVSAEDITRVASTHLSTSDYSLVIVGPENGSDTPIDPPIDTTASIGVSSSDTEKNEWDGRKSSSEPRS